MRYLILIFTFILFSLFATADEKNFFNEAKDLFDKEKYEDSKFLFHRNIVYNPKDSASYLYLAKIFKIEDDKSGISIFNWSVKLTEVITSLGRISE